MLHVVLWKWWQPSTSRAYTSEHVDMMAEMLHDNLSGVRYRVICVTDDDSNIMECETFPLWSDHDDLANASGRQLPSCYRRLKLYDPSTQREMGIRAGDRILSLDIDTLICGSLVDVVRTEGRFVGWQVPGQYHPRVFNGSFQMFTAGDLEHIWKDFDPEVSPRKVNKLLYTGSDQAWLSHCLVGKEGSVGLGYPTIASYPNHVQKIGQHSAKTRILFFNGSLKPWSPEAIRRTPWITGYWRNKYADFDERARQSR